MRYSNLYLAFTVGSRWIKLVAVGQHNNHVTSRVTCASVARLTRANPNSHAWSIFLLQVWRAIRPIATYIHPRTSNRRIAVHRYQITHHHQVRPHTPPHRRLYSSLVILSTRLTYLQLFRHLQKKAPAPNSRKYG